MKDRIEGARRDAFMIRDKQLIERLDALVDDDRRRRPWRRLSREALAREILWKGTEAAARRARRS